MVCFQSGPTERRRFYRRDSDAVVFPLELVAIEHTYTGSDNAMSKRRLTETWVNALKTQTMQLYQRNLYSIKLCRTYSRRICSTDNTEMVMVSE